jgi:hypothetical protein
MPIDTTIRLLVDHGRNTYKFRPDLRQNLTDLAAQLKNGRIALQLVNTLSRALESLSIADISPWAILTLRCAHHLQIHYERITLLPCISF